MKPKPDYCRLNCSYHKTGLGHVPDTIVEKPMFAVQLEAPGGKEIEVESKEHGWGIPLWGASGFLFEEILDELSLQRFQISIHNTIRCRPPNNAYPTSKERKEAELACRHFDGSLVRYDPNLFIITFHPAAALSYRTPQYRVFIKRALEKAKRFSEKGCRPLVLMGEKAMNNRAPWLKGGIRRWQGHYWEGKL